MAYDAGYQVVVPYPNIELADVRSHVQDIIFSRSPHDMKRTGLFIAGRDVGLALEMLDVAKEAMVPPFTISVFADPSGAFTTAAAMVGKVEQHLLKLTGSGFKNRRVAVFGAKGPVGTIASVMAAQSGADVLMVGHDGIGPVAETARQYAKHFNVTLTPVDGSSAAAIERILAGADIALCCARAGVQVLSAAQIKAAASLKIVADVNAVPPLGVETIGVMDDGVPVADSPVLGIGALAIGNIKARIQHDLLKAMLVAEKPVYLSFMEAYHAAQRRLSGSNA
jgi:methylene-tetrahydromethanopterin dehydrogenase